MHSDAMNVVCQEVVGNEGHSEQRYTNLKGYCDCVYPVRKV